MVELGAGGAAGSGPSRGSIMPLSTRVKRSFCSAVALPVNGAGDVGGAAQILCARIEQHDLAGLERAIGRSSTW